MSGEDLQDEAKRLATDLSLFYSGHIGPGPELALEAAAFLQAFAEGPVADAQRYAIETRIMRRETNARVADSQGFISYEPDWWPKV
jgi:hypothetical protein